MYCWDLFYLQQKGSRRENRRGQKLNDGACTCPPESRIFCQENVWEFEPCWLDTEAWGGRQNLAFFKKIRTLGFRERKTVTSVLLGFSPCWLSFAVQIGRLLAVGMAGGRGQGPDRWQGPGRLCWGWPLWNVGLGPARNVCSLTGAQVQGWPLPEAPSKS